MNFSGLTFSLIFLTVVVRPTFSVSFYGESFIHIPIQDAFDETDLELRFKTTRPYGMIALVAGETDYFLLQLHSGTLRVTLNFGSEETVVDLGKGRFDDLQWHNVKVVSKRHEIFLIVDNQTVSQERKGDYTTLNIENGIYLGGHDETLDTNYLNGIKFFRGCISYAKFGNYNLLEKAREITNPAKIVEISWECDEIFDASRDSAISFLSDTSFISFSHLHPTKERTVSFVIQTQSQTALLLFSSLRHSTSKHFVALEIINGVLILTVCKFNEIVHMISEVNISDDKWHQIDIWLSDTSAEISVDGHSSVTEFQNKTTVPFGGLLFLGGVNQKARAVALREGLVSLKGGNSMKGALNGCIKDVIINSRAYGIHDVHVSRLIGSDCKNTACVLENCRTVENVEYEVDDNFSETLPSSDSNSADVQLLSVNPLVVEEGGRAILSTNNIEIVYNYRKHGIRDSGILLRIIDVPKHGLLEIDLGRRRSNDVFTYLDLMGKKVSYISDGTEERYDEVAMELQMVGSVDDIPQNIRKKYSFVLPINITPINDPPKILLQNHGILRIIENTKIRVKSEFLNADDPDSNPSELKYIITQPPSQGYFEKVGQIGTPILEFTQQEVNERQIWFLHLGSGTSYIHLKLTDGFASSDMADITVQTVQLYLTVVKNSGLILPIGSSAIISNFNLSTVSNVPTQELEIRYEVFRRPRYGMLERQQYTESEWRPVTVFAQRHVDQGHIRYRQTDPSFMPSADQFSFMVKAKGYTTPPYTFRVQFEQLYLDIERNNTLVLLHQPFGVVSDENLKTKTNNPNTRLESIKYTIMRPPSLGDFYRIEREQNPHTDLTKSKLLRKDSIFTQSDINSKMIYYKLRESSFDKVQDFADIRVHSTSTTAKILRFWIEFVPMKSDVRFTNKGLHNVIEGGQKAIDRRNLYIQTDAFSVFEYTVISAPQHGELQLVDPRSSAIVETEVSKFTNDDIKDLRLVYQHDDSETDKDSFTFIAVPLKERLLPSQSEIPEFTGTFEIHMLMRNDNPPVRLVDKVFKVVLEKEKLISIDDLAFTDPDIDYNPNDLKYTTKGAANGDIIHAVNKSRIYEFKQQDLVDKQILFRHHGDHHGRVVIQVTDGQFNTPCLFEIEAGDPFVEIITNTGAAVSRNNRVRISAHNLSIETNVNVADDGIRFVLIEEPRQGHLEIMEREVIEFNFKDLKDNALSYKHEGGVQTWDGFRFAIVAEGTQTQGSFQIQIELERAERPPRVINNRVLEVYGNHRSTIDQSDLLITHPDSSAENIEYLILVLPKQGTLFRNSVPLTLDDSTFTQLDINQGRVGYVLENDSATTDQLIFEVTNGFQTLRGLEFLIDIIPSSLPIEVKNFSVKEGGRKVLRSDHMKITGKKDQQKLVIFSIVDQPSHGILEFANKRSEAISTFSSEELARGRVYYSHDDSEDIGDSFSVKAELDDGSKESEIRTIYITVEGINDEAPRVIVNKGLHVWKGSMTQITADILNVYDLDTPPEELIYRISSPSNGHISHVKNTFKAIASFRQSWINDGQIVFVHSGANKGEFSFQVTDGFNSDELRTFTIEAKPLILTLDVNLPLDAYPNTVQPITAAHLMASTNDPHQSKPIIFTLASKPQFGKIVTMVDGGYLEAISFTQEQINNSEIFYDHGDSFSGWTQNDSITFTVNTLYAEPIAEQMFEIIVSYGNLNAENKNQLIKIHPIDVDEGGEMIVAKNSLDVSEFVKNLERLGKRVSLTYSLKDPPIHGQLLFRGKSIPKSKRFGQRNINSHHLIYKHDDSDTVFDTFNLTLHLRIEGQNDGEEEKETKFTLNMNVTVQPINDEQYRLITTDPSIHITQGFSKIIDSSILKTVDKDTAPEYLDYTVFRVPSNGYISYIEFPTIKIRKFSQKDIDDKRIVFHHDGSTESGEFHFKITDGVHKPEYRKFYIYVERIYMNITKNATILLLQSETMVPIGQENLNSSTNGLRENITFIIRKVPKYGKIMLKGKEVNSFTQSQIDQRFVTYVQTDMSSGYDSFICDIFYRPLDIRFEDRLVNIQVKPYVELGPLEAAVDEKVALTLLSMDASKLSEVTADNPDYKITKGPYFGRIIRKMFGKRQVYHETSRRGASYREVREFSHEDVVYMKVFYEVLNENVVEKQDNFTFLLTAFSAQPAEGVFYIGLAASDITPVIPVSKSTDINVIPVTQKSVTHSNGKGYVSGGKAVVSDEAMEPSSVKNDHILVIAIVVPILVLLILVILIVFIVWKKRRKRDYSPPSKKSPRMRPTISGPFQIDQPHVHIEPQRSPVSEADDKSLVVEYQNTGNVVGGSRAPSEERDIVMPMIQHEPHHIPRSPDISRTEISSTVPNCKVTPLIDNDDADDDETSTDENRLSRDSMSDMFDWITSDPELLQHCRSSPPVLRKNQYWV